MNLVEAGNNYYINMDTIESVFEDIKESTYGLTVKKRVRCISGEVYDISKEAYESILKYGKAKI
jgi:hypothetical protein